MKKIGMLLLALLIAFAMTACDTGGDDGDDGDDGGGAVTYSQTTLLTGNGTVALTTFTAAADGSYVELAYTNESGSARDGYGIGGVGNSWSDTDILSITTTTLADQASDTSEVTVAAIVTGATGSDVYFNLYNGVTLNTVILFEPE